MCIMPYIISLYSYAKSSFKSETEIYLFVCLFSCIPKSLASIDPVQKESMLNLFVEMGIGFKQCSCQCNFFKRGLLVGLPLSK
jgi:hypothetical protein